MTPRPKIHAVVTLLFAVLFYRFFMFTKHDPVVSPLVPFADDPYDAIGSFCMIVSFVLAFRSVFLAFRPYRAPTHSPLASLFLARTQISIPIGVLVSLVADVIALARHPGQWIHSPASARLLLLISGMALISLGLTALFRRSITPSASRRPGRRKALLITTLFIAALALIPESTIQSPGLHLLAILLGFSLIAAMQAAITVAVLPYPDHSTSPPGPIQTRRNTWAPWAAMAAFGLLLGVSVFVTEAGEGSGAPANRILLVAALFVGSGTGLALIAFAFFRKPLGLSRKSTA